MCSGRAAVMESPDESGHESIRWQCLSQGLEESIYLS